MFPLSSSSYRLIRIPLSTMCRRPYSSHGFSPIRDPLAITPGPNLILGFFLAFAPVLLSLGLLSALAFGLARLCGAAARRRALRTARRTRKALHAKRIVSALPPPTPDQLRDAWEKSRDSLRWKMLLGSMLSDLEPVVDQSHIRNAEGEIVGRNPGIRGWILNHCPDLSKHYKAMMSYKAMAARLRMASGLSGPAPAEALLELCPAGRTETAWAPEEARARARALLDAAPTMRALDDMLRERLGLPRMRRERRCSA